METEPAAEEPPAAVMPIEALLVEVVVLGATEYVTVPLPVFAVPDVKLTQSTTPFVAVQAQPAPVVTLTVPLPPLSVKVFEVGVMTYVQAVG